LIGASATERRKSFATLAPGGWRRAWPPCASATSATGWIWPPTISSATAVAGGGGVAAETSFATGATWSGVSVVKTYFPRLRFVYTRDVDLAISLSDVISIEILPSFQIATAGDRDNV